MGEGLQEETEITDARASFIDALEIVALKFGGSIKATVEKGHVHIEIIEYPPDPGLGAALETLAEAVEIATSHMCMHCGVDAEIGGIFEDARGNSIGTCLSCGAVRSTNWPEKMFHPEA